MCEVGRSSVQLVGSPLNALRGREGMYYARLENCGTTDGTVYLSPMQAARQVPTPSLPPRVSPVSATGIPFVCTGQSRCGVRDRRLSFNRTLVRVAVLSPCSQPGYCEPERLVKSLRCIQSSQLAVWMSRHCFVGCELSKETLHE